MLTPLFTSANPIALAVLSASTSFILFFAIVIILFVFALARQTIVMSMLSCMSWFALSIAIYIVGEADGLTGGISLFSLLMFFIMLILTIKQSAGYLAAEAEEKKRRIAEEVA